MGGPGVGGRWNPSPEMGRGPTLDSAPTPLGNGEDVIELDDIFDVLDNWDEFERQPGLARPASGHSSGRGPPG